MNSWPTWLVERFRSRVATTTAPDDCWLWTGNQDRNGYGRFRSRKASVDIKAHRAAYRLANGELPSLLRHTCDNPPCVRPDHLLPGDHKSNAADAIERGLYVPRARRLADEQEAAIRAQYARGGCTYRSLAREHSVSFGCIQGVMGRG